MAATNAPTTSNISNAQLNVPAEMRDIISSVANDYYDSLKNEAPYINMTFEEMGAVCRDLATQDVHNLIEQVGKEIIGEDDFHKYHSQLEDGVRNRLRAAQRQTLDALLKGEKDGN